MDNGLVTISIAMIFVLVISSAYFSMSETTFTTVNTIRLKRLDADGTKNADKALGLTDIFDRLLTTVLVGNNMMNIGASAVCTMLFTEQLLPNNPGLATILATLVMTVVILTFAEILPKTMAKRNAEKFALKLAPSLIVIMTALYPITWVFLKINKALTRKDDEAAFLTLTEDELVVMIDEIEEEGTLGKKESELIKSAIIFDDTKLSEVYIPRVDVVAVNKDINMDELKDMFVHTGYSRLPVYKDNIDNILGLINAKDFYRRHVTNDNFNLTDIIRQIKFFNESTSLDEALNVMQKTKVHMAVVLDSFGGTLGIVTLEDIIEELVGDIWDESDEIKLSVVMESDCSYTVLGDANIYNVMDELGIKFNPEGYSEYNVSGFIQYMTGDIPRKGAVVDLENVTITVKSVKGRRVRDSRFDVKRVTEESEAKEEGN